MEAVSERGATGATPFDKGSRREHVLDVAMDTFVQSGYRKTSMEDVSRAALISRPGLYFLAAKSAPSPRLTGNCSDRHYLNTRNAFERSCTTPSATTRNWQNDPLTAEAISKTLMRVAIGTKHEAQTHDDFLQELRVAIVLLTRVYSHAPVR